MNTSPKTFLAFNKGTKRDMLRILYCILAGAGSMFASSANAQVAIDNFNTVGADRGYYGNWTVTNSPVANGMLTIGSGAGTTGSPTTSGGEYNGNLSVDISQQISLRIIGARNAGNQASVIQIIIADNTPHSGATNTQARFTFDLTSFGTSSTAVTVNFSQAYYYYATTTGAYAETQVPMSNFNFQNVTSCIVQGDFSDQTLRFSLDDVSAVPEPSTWILSVGLCVFGGYSVLRRKRSGQQWLANHS